MVCTAMKRSSRQLSPYTRRTKHAFDLAHTSRYFQKVVLLQNFWTFAKRFGIIPHAISPMSGTFWMQSWEFFDSLKVQYTQFIIFMGCLSLECPHGGWKEGWLPRVTHLEYFCSGIFKSPPLEDGGFRIGLEHIIPTLPFHPFQLAIADGSILKLHFPRKA